MGRSCGVGLTQGHRGRGGMRGAHAEAQSAQRVRRSRGPHAETRSAWGLREGLTQRRRVRRGCGGARGPYAGARGAGLHAEAQSAQRVRGLVWAHTEAQRAARVFICVHPCSSVVELAFCIHLRPSAPACRPAGSSAVKDNARLPKVAPAVHPPTRRRSASSVVDENDEFQNAIFAPRTTLPHEQEHPGPVGRHVRDRCLHQ